MKSRSAIGFTLIELMVTITMIAIVLTVGVPSFQASIRNSVLTAGINEFVAALNFARGEAIKRGVNVTVRRTSSPCPSTSSSVGYEGGWQVFTDVNAHGCNDSSSDQVLRTHASLNNGYTLWGNSVVNYISYKPDGTSQNYGSFALCDATNTLTPNTARVISVSMLGRITMVTAGSNGSLTFSNSGGGPCPASP